MNEVLFVGVYPGLTEAMIAHMADTIGKAIEKADTIGKAIEKAATIGKAIEG
jgi:hypothetical protein